MEARLRSTQNHHPSSKGKYHAQNDTCRAWHVPGLEPVRNGRRRGTAGYRIRSGLAQRHGRKREPELACLRIRLERHQVCAGQRSQWQCHRRHRHGGWTIHYVADRAIAECFYAAAAGGACFDDAGGGAHDGL